MPTTVSASALLIGPTPWSHEWTEDGLLILTSHAPDLALPGIRTGVQLVLDEAALVALADSVVPLADRVRPLPVHTPPLRLARAGA